MWESRRDFQRVLEGWEAGFMAFHAFHTLPFPWPALRCVGYSFWATHRPKPELFYIEFSYLGSPEKDFVEPISDLLETDVLKAEYIADEDPFLMPRDVPAVIDSSSQKSLGVDELRHRSR